ncbi:uncharacterized protein [Primulina eburnea]|uniref:uncharacterized protein isoform X1 n=1 Tax=Primulina eburnea TaxID=1245227 RepID=UPI003C6C39BC
MASFALLKPCIHNNSLQIAIPHLHPFSKSLRQCSSSRFGNGGDQIGGGKSNRVPRIRVNAVPDWPLMAVMVEHMEGQRDLIIHKSIWHLSDHTIKNVYMFYIMFTCWGCCFYGATKVCYFSFLFSYKVWLIFLCFIKSSSPSKLWFRIHIMIQKPTGKMEEMVQDIGSMRSKKTRKKKRGRSCGVRI